MEERRKFKYKVVKRRSNKSIVINARSKYCLTYIKDTIVKAPEGTLGIMVFKTKKDAELFAECHDDNSIIKKVVPIGRGRSPETISRKVGTRELNEFYKTGSMIQVPPSGTICYPEVIVVD